MIVRLVRSPGFFRYWLGHGAILFASVAAAAAWRKGPLWLAAGVLALALFWLETSTGYCRRCTHFNCGPHGSVMRRLFRRDPAPLPRSRLALHVSFDILMAAAGLYLIGSEWPPLIPPAALWVGGAALSVFPASAEARRDASKWGGTGPR
ncbi:MAG: hypothetical protein ACE5JH_02780 [Acidobacteriota bacterium]